MKAFNNYEEAKKEARNTGSSKLPQGAYVCKVLAVRYEEGIEGRSDRLVLQIDVAEGEQKDFFKKQYEANQSEDKKWKGVVNIYVPMDDGTEKDGWTKRTFGTWMNAFEDSNVGYSWNWDENTLKGKLVGILYGETGTVIEGRHIIYTEPRKAYSVPDVKNNKVPEAKFKEKNGFSRAMMNQQNAPVKTDKDGFVAIPDGVDEEIPF